MGRYSWSKPSLDPYDIWASRFGVFVKSRYYKGSSFGKLYALAIGLLDWFLPTFGRQIFLVKPKLYPISLAHEIMRAQMGSNLSELEEKEILDCVRKIGILKSGEMEYSWGLGFPWMSKNGLYEPNIPFITHTPYIMEALLTLRSSEETHAKSMGLFYGTWEFLESLKVMFESNSLLSLSYAPIDEPRMVVNANSYASFAYALHAAYGKPVVSKDAKLKAKKIVAWVMEQQNSNGSWFYYADQDRGNFIDCFHSCFIVKNLLKVSKILPELAEVIQPAINKGWAFIRSDLYDGDTHLCRRFTSRAQRDPFKLDLYDQAEYLGLLVDFGLLDEAVSFSKHVERKFRKGDDWYCRIDIFGRRWGKNFLRWGIVPFWYHQARLKQALEKK